MWKESYRIGIEVIDRQHQELFRMADELMKAIESRAEPEKFREAVVFLKQYVVYHFREEEKYQESIGYEGLEEHRKQHHSFTATVLDYEKKLVESDYDIRVVKDLMGTLTAWLIYHVADADQRYAGRRESAAEERTQGKSYAELFAGAAENVLQTMAGLDPAVMAESSGKNAGDDVVVRVGIVGEKQGEVRFGFSRELAFRLIEIMTMVQPEQVDELVCSALAELSNIAAGNAATLLAGEGLTCDIQTPEVAPREPETDLEALRVDTGEGELGVAVGLR